MNPQQLTTDQITPFLKVLQARFHKHQHRHPGLEWNAVEEKLLKNPQQLWSLYQMEQSGGEPDVIGQEKSSGAFMFVDCAPESPVGRRSLCYDRAGLESRKEHRPENTACDLANSWQVELLDETQYKQLQELGDFDTKTSSWIATPADVRKLGGALYGDCRYQRVFIYHNGAQSYYAARGFRVMLMV